MYLSEARESISAAGLAGSGATILPAGSLMITTRATLGARAINTVPMTTNQGFKSLVFGSAHDAPYYYYLTDKLKPEFKRRASGTTFLEVSGAELAKIEVPVPSVDERRCIADVLGTLDTAIRQTEAIIEKLKQVKQGLLHDLLTRGIDDNGELRDLDRHPEQFQECQLGRTPRSWGPPRRLDKVEADGEVKLGRGNVISADDIFRMPGPHPIYSSSSMGTGEFGRYGRFMFDEELITWSIDGGGRPFYRPAHRFSVTNVCGFLRVSSNSRWNYRFLHALMSHQHSRIQFDWLMKAHPSVIRQLYWFPRPPLEEQEEIARVLDAHDGRTAKEFGELSKLRLVKAGLMDDLLTGRVRVTPLLEAAAA